jgi:tyrosinase
VATFVRRDIWNLEDEGGLSHPIIEAFGDAVGVMKQRSRVDPGDPTGWTYQAGVHALANPAVADAFLHQCQHGSWFFLPRAPHLPALL